MAVKKKKVTDNTRPPSFKKIDTVKALAAQGLSHKQIAVKVKLPATNIGYILRDNGEEDKQEVMIVDEQGMFRIEAYKDWILGSTVTIE